MSDEPVSKTDLVIFVIIAATVIIVIGGPFYPETQRDDPDCDAEARNTGQCELVCYDRALWWKWGSATYCVWKKTATEATS